MTIWVDSATTRSKLQGIVQGIVDAVGSRLTPNYLDAQVVPLKKALTAICNEAVELGEDSERKNNGKELVALIAKANTAVDEALAKAGSERPAEERLARSAIRNLISEAVDLGKQGAK